MGDYRIQEADLTVPDGWSDQSLSVFKIPGAEGRRDASFVITRDPTRGGTAFDAYVARQQAQCRESLPGFKLRHADAFAFGEWPAAWMEFTWSNQGTELLLRQVYIDRGPTVLICTLTAHPDDLAHLDPVWRSVMNSLRLRPLPEAPPFPPLRPA
jgi:hypothetical protein